MRGEDHVHLAAGDLGEGLLDLGRVAVLGHAVGLHGLVGVAVVGARVGPAAGAGDARDGVGDDQVAAGQARGEGGRGGKGRGRGVAARHGDQNGLAGGAALGQREDALAVELGQAVDGLGEELWAGVGRVVPLLVDLRVV